jgi:LysR family transcriptional regulator, mexEF-oprN operon transcriptional activator
LIHSGFSCLFDPRFVKVKARIREREYFAHDHVIVSYNADLRGIVEDMLHKQRRVRCAVGSFSHVGSVLEGSALLATVPSVVARHLLRVHPRLRSAELPFAMQGGHIELLWPLTADDDDASRLVRDHIRQIAREQKVRSRKR